MIDRLRLRFVATVEVSNVDKKSRDGEMSVWLCNYVDVYYNAGHPGVEEPHAHIVLWHVPAGDEASVAQ